MKGWISTAVAIVGLGLVVATAVLAWGGDRKQIEVNAAHAEDSDKHWTPAKDREVGRLIERLEAVTDRMEKL